MKQIIEEYGIGLVMLILGSGILQMMKELLVILSGGV